MKADLILCIVLACFGSTTSNKVKFRNWTIGQPGSEVLVGNKHGPAKNMAHEHQLLSGRSVLGIKTKHNVNESYHDRVLGCGRIQYIFDEDVIDSCDLIKKYKPDARSGNYTAVTCQKIAIIRCDFSDTPTAATEKTTPITDFTATPPPSQPTTVSQSPDATTNYDCLDILRNNPNAKSGPYIIRKPREYYMSVYCDMDEDGGGWTVFQRRNRSLNNVNFSRNWAEYQDGFGDLEGEFWLGNRNIYHLANNNSQSNLSITLRQDYSYGAYEKIIYTYSNFYLIGNGNYSLSPNLTSTTSPIGSSQRLLTHAGRNFTTYEMSGSGWCSQYYGDCGGWWYQGACFDVQLNAAHKFPPVKFSSRDTAGIRWFPASSGSFLDYTLAVTVMKMRRST